MTVGMRIDSIIESVSDLSNLSSTQLYTVIVVVTSLIATILLGSGDQPKLEMADKTASLAASAPQKPKPVADKNSPPEPRWYIFRMFNYAMLFAFVLSLGDFMLNYSAYALDSSVLLRFLLGWSACLIYFFGFFGVSFVHDVVPNPEDPTSMGVAPAHPPMQEKIVSKSVPPQ